MTPHLDLTVSGHIPRTVAPASFAERLSNDGMRQLLRYWVACRGHMPLPRRPQFDPLRFRKLLPHMQLHERKPDGRYLCKVSGTAVVEAYGFESTNRYVDDVINPSHLKSRIAILDETLDGGRPVFYAGSLVLAGREWQGFQRLALPVADADGAARFIFSLLDFTRRPPQAEPIPGLADTDRHGIAFKVVARDDELRAD